MTNDNTTQDFDSIRAEMEASFKAAQDRAARRLHGGTAEGLSDTRRRARELVTSTRARARDRLGMPGSALPEPAPSSAHGPDARPGLSLQDLHTLERLTSYVRHSIVRVCFYNLKLFCPSLVDEYDAHVRDQVVENIERLAGAREEIERFFDQPLSEGRRVGELFPDVRRDTFARLDSLVALARPVQGRLDEESVRCDFAQKAPPLIDAVMESLQGIQAELDSHKLSVGELVEEAARLAAAGAEQAGLTLHVDCQPTPRVFGEQGPLVNAFSELINNAAKYSAASDLHIAVRSAENGQYVTAEFADTGKGMSPDEVEDCVKRGVSTGGTGEGLPMVVEIVEHSHFGHFTITAAPGAGCTAQVSLPVKLNARKDIA
ncbi:MAG: HAMP domain-containing histidine kinase [Candidatus Hydrogenedentes bacterium]|nr:HAMP domain-containing histidine kinase [Candidatus Hydrogenedentota bacterium]